MLVGSADRFAIEFDFDEDQADEESRHFCFGHVRCILAGSTVGDPKAHSSLSTVAWAFQCSIEYRPHRRAVDGFCERPAAAVFAELDWVVYGVGRDDASWQIADPRERPFRYFFVNPTEDALPQKLVVIECGATQRVIWEKLEGGLGEVFLDAGEFEAVASEFIDAVNRKMQRES